MEIVRYHAVDDVGHMINPLLVEGQLHGGIAQGVGQALIENIVYQDLDGVELGGQAVGDLPVPSGSRRRRRGSGARPGAARGAPRVRRRTIASMFSASS